MRRDKALGRDREHVSAHKFYDAIALRFDFGDDLSQTDAHTIVSGTNLEGAIGRSEREQEGRQTMQSSLESPFLVPRGAVRR